MRSAGAGPCGRRAAVGGGAGGAPQGRERGAGGARVGPQRGAAAGRVETGARGLCLAAGSREAGSRERRGSLLATGDGSIDCTPSSHRGLSAALETPPRSLHRSIWCDRFPPPPPLPRSAPRLSAVVNNDAQYSMPLLRPTVIQVMRINAWVTVHIACDKTEYLQAGRTPFRHALSQKIKALHTPRKSNTSRTKQKGTQLRQSFSVLSAQPTKSGSRPVLHRPLRLGIAQTYRAICAPLRRRTTTIPSCTYRAWQHSPLLPRAHAPASSTFYLTFPHFCTLNNKRVIPPATTSHYI